MSSKDRSIEKCLDELIELTKSNPSEAPPEIAELPFGEFFWPWLEVAQHRLNAQTTPNHRMLLNDHAHFSLKKSLVQRWSRCCAPSLTLEMAIARRQGILTGKTSQERYASFIQQKLVPANALRHFFQEYSLVGRLVATFLIQWVNQVTTFLKHLEKDHFLLAQHFQPNKSLGKVTAIEMQLGDFHCHGKSVCSLTFEAGLTLFYKPKNLSIVTHFNSLVEELNQLGLTPALQTYALLNQGTYCWEKKVSHLPCPDIAALNRFFQRAGMLLGLTYLFQSCDLHYENFIACGEYPFLIDLETLFCTSLENSTYQSPGDSQLLHSVLSTAMLPQYTLGEPQRPGFDMSAFTAHLELHPSRATPQWKNLNTDQMHLIYERQSIKNSKNKHRAIFNNKVVSASDHVDKIVEGFETIYTFMTTHQHQILRAQGPFWKMAQSSVRLVLRSTTFYTRLLESLFDPVVCLDPKQIEQVLEPLQRYPLHKEAKLHAAIVAEEKRALLRGDIPSFHALPMQPHLYVEEHLIAKKALKEIPYLTVKKRLQTMNARECDFQTTLIRQAFHAHQSDLHASFKNLTSSSSHSEPLDLPLLNRHELLTNVLAIATDLRARAFQSKDDALGWIAMEALPSIEQLAVRSTTENFYNGASGIALFFGALNFVTKDPKWKIEALNTLLPLKNFLSGHAHAKNRLIAIHGIGGMTGVGGIIYGLFQTGKLIQEPNLIDLSLELLATLEERHIKEDTLLDIIGGSAGLLLSLLSLYQHSGTAQALSLAKFCGHHLCERAVKVGLEQVTWKTLKGATLTGFSHGTAGISYALMKLAHFTQEQRFLDYALRALAFERSHFCHKKGNWSDLRYSPPTYTTVQWCHGATGIGLGRLAALPYYEEAAFHQEIEVALKISQQHLIGDLHHLCCGSFGRIAFLQDASKVLKGNHSDLDSLIWRACTTIFSPSVGGQSRLEIKTDQHYYNPSFMRGTAGIGYTLLRLLDHSHTLPQALILE